MLENVIRTFDGSAGAMEPEGILSMFERSLSHKLRCKNLIADGDSKTHTLLLEKQPYGDDPEHQVKKVDCIVPDTFRNAWALPCTI